MSKQIITNVILFDREDIVVTKRIVYNQEQGRTPYVLEKHGSVSILGNELILRDSTSSTTYTDTININLDGCNNLLTLIDCYLSSDLKGQLKLKLAEGITLHAEIKTKGSKNLLIKDGYFETFLTPFDARTVMHCVKNVLSFLAKD